MTEHYQQVVNASDVSWALPNVIWHLEDLRLGMCYPNFYVSRLASKFVKVCLSGAGGDELYAGYPWRYYRVFDAIGRDHYLRQYYEFWQRLVMPSEGTITLGNIMNFGRDWSLIKTSRNCLQRIYGGM
jgi:asparagine synthase (glutamine-hydrolysing)